MTSRTLSFGYGASATLFADCIIDRRTPEQVMERKWRLVHDTLRHTQTDLMYEPGKWEALNVAEGQGLI